MSPQPIPTAVIDRAVFDFILDKFGIDEACRYIARTHKSDGIDYTRDRHKWLPKDPGEFDRRLKANRPAFEKFVAEWKSRKSEPGRKTESPEEIIAEHIDYTRDRHKWLPQDPGEIDRPLAAENPDHDSLAAKSMGRKRQSRHRVKTTVPKKSKMKVK